MDPPWPSVSLPRPWAPKALTDPYPHLALCICLPARHLSPQKVGDLHGCPPCWFPLSLVSCRTRKVQTINTQWITQSTFPKPFTWGHTASSCSSLTESPRTLTREMKVNGSCPVLSLHCLKKHTTPGHQKVRGRLTHLGRKPSVHLVHKIQDFRAFLALDDLCD